MAKKLLFLFFTFFTLNIYAQNVTRTGTVVDGENLPLIGVNVIIKGSSSPFFPSKEKLPSKSVVVPTVLPFIITLTPIKGRFSTSTTVPVIVTFFIRHIRKAMQFTALKRSELLFYNLNGRVYFFF